MSKELPKNRKVLRIHPIPNQMGVSEETYDSYLKEYKVRMRRLKREQSGLNMVEPEEQ